MSSLAAARADNFYYPPGFDPKKHKSLNKYNGQHPLRERAKKIDQGILVIRFEVPYNIWCDKCGAHIAKGVRFNAEKKAIGNYHSTKIWQFSMTHHCGSKIIIETDPKNAEYKVVQGGRQKIETYSAKDAGVPELPDEKEKEKLANPMFKLETQELNKDKVLKDREALANLQDVCDVKNNEPYALNQLARARLRAEKQADAEENVHRKRLGLAEGIKLVPETEMDRTVAALKFRGSNVKARISQSQLRNSILTQSIFSKGASSSSTGVSSQGGARSLKALMPAMKVTRRPGA